VVEEVRVRGDGVVVGGVEAGGGGGERGGGSGSSPGMIGKRCRLQFPAILAWSTGIGV